MTTFPKNKKHIKDFSNVKNSDNRHLLKNQYETPKMAAAKRMARIAMVPVSRAASRTRKIGNSTGSRIRSSSCRSSRVTSWPSSSPAGARQSAVAATAAVPARSATSGGRPMRSRAAGLPEVRSEREAAVISVLPSRDIQAAGALQAATGLFPAETFLHALRRKTGVMLEENEKAFALGAACFDEETAAVAS